jgi:hypothetical protein
MDERINQFAFQAVAGIASGRSCQGHANVCFLFFPLL